MSISEILQRRRQFLLGPPQFSAVDGWANHQMDEKLLLSVHPDLPVSRFQEDDLSLTLVGELLDPIAQNDSNQDILRRVGAELQGGKQLNDLPRLTRGFFGRWVIIATCGSEAFLMHDAAGQRQVHFAQHDGTIYCASQAKQIAQHLELQPDPQAVSFWQSIGKSKGDFWWPGDRTMFRQVRRLLPNHSLNLRSGERTRYFGADGIPSRTMGESVLLASELLRGAFLSARRRFRLALGCTAGWDSRLLMAASWPICQEVFYYSRRHFYRSLEHPDIAVPRRLLSTNGASHHIVNMPQRMSDEFADIYRANLDTPHEDWGIMAEGEYQGLPEKTCVVWGTVAEVGRAYYWEGGVPEEVTPDLLVRIAAGLGLKPSVVENLSGSEREFAVEAFEEWLAGAQFGEGLDTLDMFAWEQVAGSWAAMWNDEVAVAHETIPLFNGHDYLTALLSVDEPYRRFPDQEFHGRLINYLWGEALSEPINPRMSPSSRKVRRDAVTSLIRKYLPAPAVALLRKSTQRGRGV